MRYLKKAVFLFLGLGIIIISSYYSYSLGYKNAKNSCPVCKPEEIDFSLFWEAYYKLLNNFSDPQKITPQSIVYGAIEGMVNALNDPYTNFFTPEDSKIFEEDVKGVFEGIGIEIGKRKGLIQVIAPLEGTPAKKAGLKAGDKILAVDDKSIEKFSLEEVIKMIRGPKGTKVKLTIIRDEWSAPKDIEIQRDVINIPSLKFELKENNTIAYIKIYHFSEKAAEDFKNIAFEIIKTPAKKIIIDLRNNPGGYLEVAQYIASWFIKEGGVVAIEKIGEKETKEFKSLGPGIFSSYKIVVLINKGSASASEILAGALKDNKEDVILVGEQSFGKGSVQIIEKLRDNSSLKITVAKWLTPKGEMIDEIGLKPDIEVKYENNSSENEDKEETKDIQLEKALEIIKNSQ